MSQAVRTTCGTISYFVTSGVLAVVPLASNEAGRVAGAEAMAILGGAKPRVLPSIRAGPLTFDDRVVRRLAIPGWRRPKGAVLRFQEPTLWARVRPYALATVALVLAQAALIGLLLVNRRHRMRQGLRKVVRSVVQRQKLRSPSAA